MRAEPATCGTSERSHPAPGGRTSVASLPFLPLPVGTPRPRVPGRRSGPAAAPLRPVSYSCVSMPTPGRDRPHPRPHPAFNSDSTWRPSLPPSVPPTENSEGGLLEESVPTAWLALAGARRIRGRERPLPVVSSWTRQEARAEGGRASRGPDGGVPSATSEAWVWARQCPWWADSSAWRVVPPTACAPRLHLR